MKVLLTGGAGYIGSHTAVALLQDGHEVAIVDNLSNSSAKVIGRVERLTNKPLTFYERDLLDIPSLEEIFSNHQFDAVVHFAGLKAVGESVSHPLAYYRTNLISSINLFNSMLRHNVNHLVFSSSATVYGDPTELPITEKSTVVDASSPYGRTKLMIEKILEDTVAANPGFSAALLRYFNPGGAHPSGEIGEDPRGIPNNLLPFVSQVAVGRRDHLVIHGSDYETPDGTCIRDYIHVTDLAAGHLAALNRLQQAPGLVTYNLGTGHGSSVKEVVAAFEQANHLKIPVKMGPRRDGDIPASYTSCDKANDELGWQATLTIEEICLDPWHWQSKIPTGNDD